MNNDKVIAIRYLIHDSLYKNKDEAKKCEDGKNLVAKVFVIMFVEDANIDIINAYENGIMIFDDIKNVVKELEDSIN
jgi:hypothetical protein